MVTVVTVVATVAATLRVVRFGSRTPWNPAYAGVRRLLAVDRPGSALGLGCIGMSEFYGQTNDDESLATLTQVLK